ncbi:MAG: alpha/beta family hydrolase [Terracidiphilus sp.]|jgi:alpha/beta superfamily hydrolase
MNSTIAPIQPGPASERATLPSPSLRSIDLAGPSGRLEALVNEGAPDAPFAALVCHPHPLGGGTMNNKVVYNAMKVLNDPAWGFAWPVLRFNFRGTGLSQGAHDGETESEDVAAALDWLVNEYKRPLVVAGFSFGAAMALKACCGGDRTRPELRAFIALGLPTQSEDRSYRYPFLAGCAVPKLFLSGDRDQYAPAAQLTQVVESAAEPKRLLLLAGADHFFTGHLAPMQRSLAGWLKEQLS